MNIWKMNVPNSVCNGPNSVKKLVNLIPKSIKNVFVVIDKNIESTDFSKKIKELLKDYNVVYWSNFNSDPSIEEIIDGAKNYREHNTQCLIALGGGSAIDGAKAIGLLGENYFPNIEKCFEPGNSNENFPYFIAIPTTCGTGAESSPYAIIKNNSMYKKMTMKRDFFIPKGVILDVKSLKTLSKQYRAATALDTLVHMIEVHTAKTSNELVRINTRGSLVSFGQSFEEAIFNNNEEALESLLYIAFTTRLLYPGTGLSIAHSIAHPLGAYSGLHHGMIVSLLMPEVIRFNESSSSALFDEAAFLFKNMNSGLELASWIEDVLERTGIYNIAKSKFENAALDIDDICSQALASSNVKSNPRKISSSKDIENILNLVLQKIKNS